jgi:hypothetical protein
MSQANACANSGYQTLRQQGIMNPALVISMNICKYDEHYYPIFNLPSNENNESFKNVVVGK